MTGTTTDTIRYRDETVEAHLSTVCLAVHFRPSWFKGLKPDQQEEAVRAALRTLALVAASDGLVIPVVGVVQCGEPGPSLETARRWVGDQDWHRGEYILFAAEDEARALERMTDVLEPRWPEVKVVADPWRERLDRHRAHDADIVEAFERFTDGGGSAESIAAAWHDWLAQGRAATGRRGTDSPLHRERQPAAPTDARPRGLRLVKAEVKHIGGWTGHEAPGLDFDADLVLIEGPNGMGKSSLLRALCLGLTGSVPQEKWRISTAGPDLGSVTLTCRSPTEGEEKLGVLLSEGGWAWTEQGLQRPDHPVRQDTETTAPQVLITCLDVWFPGSRMPPHLQRRLTLATPHAVDEPYDVAQPPGWTYEGPASLVGHLELHDAHQARQAALAGLGQAFAQWKLDTEGEVSEHRRQAVGPDWADNWRAFAQRVAPTLRDAGEAAQLPPPLQEVVDGVELQGLRQTTHGAFESALDELVASMKEQQEERLRRRELELDEEVKRLEKELAEVRDCLGPQFEMVGALRHMVHFLDHPRGPPQNSRLLSLWQELGRVQRVAASKLLEDAEAIQGAHQSQRNRLEQRRVELEQVRERLKTAQPDRTELIRRVESLRTDEGWKLPERFREERERVRQRHALADSRTAALEAMTGRVQALRQQLEGIGTSPTAGALEGLVRRILQRFHIAAMPGPESAQVKLLPDGLDARLGPLGPEAFSTGTYSQVGLSRVVAQKLLSLADGVGPELQCPNRVLLLDDPSVAYDLTNLTRESLLWRQLAFHPDSTRRIQIVLGTHHDTLTNRLYDLLTPPPGSKVLVHRLVDWSLEKGPTVQTFELLPAEEARRPFDERVKEILKSARAVRGSAAMSS